MNFTGCEKKSEAGITGLPVVSRIGRKFVRRESTRSASRQVRCWAAETNRMFPGILCGNKDTCEVRYGRRINTACHLAYPCSCFADFLDLPGNHLPKPRTPNSISISLFITPQHTSQPTPRQKPHRHIHKSTPHKLRTILPQKVHTPRTGDSPIQQIPEQKMHSP